MMGTWSAVYSLPEEVIHALFGSCLKVKTKPGGFVSEVKVAPHGPVTVFSQDTVFLDDHLNISSSYTEHSSELLILGAK